MQAVYFIVGFVIVLGAFISFIVFLAKRLGGKVPYQLYRVIESIIIAGIVLGIFGMFQPWVHVGFRVGFHVLLFSLLGFIVWSHITPQHEHYEEEHVGDLVVHQPKAG